MNIIYFKLIIAGRRTFLSIAAQNKPAVQALFMEQVRAGVMTPQQYEIYVGEAYSEV